MTCGQFGLSRVADACSLDAAPSGYKDFDKGAATKFVIDPHNYTGLC